MNTEPVPRGRSADHAPVGRRASPIGVFEDATRTHVDVRVRFLAVVALASARGDWLDDGAALAEATKAELRRVERLLRSIADNSEVVRTLGPSARHDARVAAALVARSRDRRPRSRRPTHAASVEFISAQHPETLPKQSSVILPRNE
jgi:hypothetical protein